MNRNTETYFSNVSSLTHERSGFDLSHDIKTTFNTGDLIPVSVIEVLPGDTHSLDMSAVIRMTTPIFPVMDNAYIDYYRFFVPNRLVWNHWREFMGENTQTAWEPETEYTIPQIEAPSGGFTEGTIADYYGIPTKVSDISFSALPFRGYCLIWNEWFRDQTRKDPCMIHLDETTRTGSNASNDYVNKTELGGAPLKARKFHDLYTSTTPTPQRGPDTFIPLGGATGTRPVVGNGKTIGLLSGNNTSHKDFGLVGINDGAMYGIYNRFGTEAGTTQTNGNLQDAAIKNIGLTKDPENSGLVALLDYSSGGTATNSTINQLRQAFAVQSFYERLGTAGSRYTEMIRSMFGVTSPDARQQRPELIGGERIAVNVNAVLQTSSTDSTSPQGNVAANSSTVFFNHNMGVYSATEHGYIHILAVVRTDRTYQQGLEKHFTRKTMFDFYFPQFANIGEQAILNEQIYAQGTDEDKEVFGYQEAWAEYRFIPNRVTGLMRSNATGSLDSWHYADYYTELPIGVSGDWIDEPSTNLARTLAVQDEPQFFGAFRIGDPCYRAMPVHSAPFNMII